MPEINCTEGMKASECFGRTETTIGPRACRERGLEPPASSRQSVARRCRPDALGVAPGFAAGSVATGWVCSFSLHRDCMATDRAVVFSFPCFSFMQFR